MKLPSLLRTGPALALVLVLAGALLVGSLPSPAAPKESGKSYKLPRGVPEKVATVLRYIDKHRKAPEGYVGGRTFGNFEKLLPQKDRRGRKVRYQEWDVNRKVPGKNRGAERLVTGSDGSAYYTRDHYKSFIKIR